MTAAASAKLKRPGGHPLAVWSFRLALSGFVLALTAAITGAIVPPAWYVQDVGASAAMPALSLVSGACLLASLGASFTALVVGLVALVRGQRGWEAIVAIVTVVTLYPTVGAAYFVLGLFLYD